MALLDGKKLAKSIRKQVKEQVADFVDKYGRPPTLDVVLVGEDPASQIYVRNKAKACRKAGLGHHEHRLPEETPAGELLELVRSLSADDKVDGVLVQLPLPEQILPDVVISAISPLKDVDGFHPTNLGNLFAGKPGLRPCTPVGCMKLLDEAGVDLEGKNAVVVGRSNIVGKPMAIMLLERHASVTICHSRTEKLAHVVAEADVVVISSYREASPIVLLESMAAGTPWISFEMGCVKENVGGIVVRSYEEMACKAIELVTDAEKKKEMGELGRKRSIEKHDWDSIAKEHEKLYYDISTHRNA